jgi:hypothetical protein
MSNFSNNMSYNDFVKRLKKSQESVIFMKQYFENKDYIVEIPELIIAPHSVGAYSEYSDNGDMFITKNSIKEKVEIKQSSRTFNLTNWPYESVIINSITGYNSKNPKPDIHIVLSKDRNYAYAIRKNTFEKNMFLKKIYDSYKKAELLFYLVNKEFATFFKL